MDSLNISRSCRLLNRGNYVRASHDFWRVRERWKQTGKKANLSEATETHQ